MRFKISVFNSSTCLKKVICNVPICLVTDLTSKLLDECKSKSDEFVLVEIVDDLFYELDSDF